MRIPGLCAVMLGAISGHALAADTVLLPAAVCAPGDSIFVADFDAAGVIPHAPSQGTGGQYPGKQQRTITIGAASHKYYLYVPDIYAPNQSAPLIIVLHGAAGNPALADQQARSMRNDWSAAANRYGFMVLAPIGTSIHGSWEVPADYDVIETELADVEQRYNVERSRISLWGFSAGGYVAWDTLLNGNNYVPPLVLNASTLATLGSSGSNSSFACSPNPTPSQCASLMAALPRKVPIDMHIGLQDTQHLSWTQADRQRLLNLGWIEGQTLSYTEFNGGHVRPTAQQRDQIAGFMCRFAVQP